MRYSRRATESPLPISAGEVFYAPRQPLWPRWCIALAVVALIVGCWPR
jgi:hypothetical protein